MQKSSDINKTVHNFLQKMQMDNQSIDVDRNCGQFILEMENGLFGKKSSLKMIPTYLTLGGDVPCDKPVIVLDAGGTNLRVSVLRFAKDGRPQIEYFENYKMPGVEKEISSDDFFEIVTSYLLPVINKSDRIGFCFSYAAKPTQDMDGEIIEMGKQLRIKDFIGKKLGQCLKNSLKSQGIKEDKKVVVLNDSVATLLGGKAASGNREYSGYIGFILGTGTNTCYAEKLDYIKKDRVRLVDCDPMIINMETCGYDKFSRSDVDLQLDAGTIDPGHASFEKMISGKYQGDVLKYLVTAAIKEGLFSSHFINYFNRNIETISGKEIDNFLFYPYGNNKLAQGCDCFEDDCVTLFYLIDAIAERSAKLVMINFASVLLKTGQGTNPCRPVCIMAEGSTFNNSRLFKGKLEFYIKKYMNEKMNLYCDIMQAENATLIGTAIAALVN